MRRHCHGSNIRPFFFNGPLRRGIARATENYFEELTINKEPGVSVGEDKDKLLDKVRGEQRHAVRHNCNGGRNVNLEGGRLS